MEIKVFVSATHYAKHNAAFCRKVECPDCFDYLGACNVFKSIFGSQSIIEFTIV